MTLIAILATIAKQEHARLSERVVAGLRRAKREGKVLGRQRVILDRRKIRTMHAKGHPVRVIAAKIGVSKSHVSKILVNGSPLTILLLLLRLLCSCARGLNRFFKRLPIS